MSSSWGVLIHAKVLSVNSLESLLQLMRISSMPPNMSCFAHSVFSFPLPSEVLIPSDLLFILT